jgi:hypothetical protein
LKIKDASGQLLKKSFDYICGYYADSKPDVIKVLTGLKRLESQHPNVEQAPYKKHKSIEVDRSLGGTFSLSLLWLHREIIVINKY